MSAAFTIPAALGRVLQQLTRHLDRLGQLGEFEQDSNPDSELESNTDSRACVLQQRQGLSTGLASSVSSSRTATLTRSWKATQTHTVRKAKHRL